MGDNGSSGWEFAAGFFIGGVVGGLLGAAAALLMAPQAGEDTRTALREKGIELKERATSATDEARHKLDDATGEIRKRAEETTGELREKTGEIRKLAEEKTAGIRESARLALDDNLSQVKDAYQSGKQAGEQKMDELRKSLRNPPAGSPADPFNPA